MDQFLEWASANDVAAHAAIEFRQSPLGGFGIFTTHSIPENSIVLRIPQQCTLDLTTLLQQVEKMKTKDESNQVALVMKLVLLSRANFTETAIIRSYMWGFAILQSMGHRLAIEPYLEILKNTEVLKVDDSENDSDHLVQLQVLEKRRMREEHKELLQELEYAQYLSFETAYALHQAVKLRVLEIPHAEGEDDYTTNITLVPMLDFANHAEKNNAVFDVDRRTEDVILRLRESVTSGSEVCISYSPTKDMEVFFRTYGFIPQTGVYKWRLPNLNCILNEVKHTSGENYQLIAKWLQIVPQLVIQVNHTVSLDLSDFRLPLLLVPDLKYHESWRTEKEDLSELSDYYPGTVAQIIGLIEAQEKDSDIIHGSDTAFGVVCNDAYISLSNILAQTWEDSEDGIELLIKLAIPPIQMAAKCALDDDAKAALRHCSPAVSSYFKFKLRVLQKVLEFSFEDYLRMKEVVQQHAE